MQLGIAALFIIWMISRSNLTTSTPATPKWVVSNPSDFPISFTQGVTRGSIGIQMWTGEPTKWRNYVVYQGGQITPLVPDVGSKQQAVNLAHSWLTHNADAPEESIAPQSIDAPEAPPPEDVTINTGGRGSALIQSGEAVSLNGQQDYSLNG